MRENLETFLGFSMIVGFFIIFIIGIITVLEWLINACN